MSKRRSGVLSRLRYQIKTGRGGKRLMEYLQELLKGPCAYCGQPGCDSIDHVVPKSKGGRTKRDNLVACHKACNEKKGDNDV